MSTTSTAAGGLTGTNSNTQPFLCFRFLGNDTSFLTSAFSTFTAAAAASADTFVDSCSSTTASACSSLGSETSSFSCSSTCKCSFTCVVLFGKVAFPSTAAPAAAAAATVEATAPLHGGLMGKSFFIIGNIGTTRFVLAECFAATIRIFLRFFAPAESSFFGDFCAFLFLTTRLRGTDGFGTVKPLGTRPELAQFS